MRVANWKGSKNNDSRTSHDSERDGENDVSTNCSKGTSGYAAASSLMSLCWCLPIHAAVRSQMLRLVIQPLPSAHHLGNCSGLHTVRAQTGGSPRGGVANIHNYIHTYIYTHINMLVSMYMYTDVYERIHIEYYCMYICTYAYRNMCN